MKGFKPILLVGPPGVGKTSFIHCLVKYFDYDLIELNASDTRNKDSLDKLLSPVFNNSSIFGKRILLFIDEVDGISGREDSGGLDVIIRLLRNGDIPVALAANSNNMKIKELAKTCKVIGFNKVGIPHLHVFLNYLINKNSLTVDETSKIQILTNSKGDVRKLINILQSFDAGYRSDSKILNKMDIEDGLNLFFSTNSEIDAKDILDRIDTIFPDTRFGLSPEERRKDLIYALFSSVINSKIDQSLLPSILDEISKIDMMIQRMNSKRNWSLLKFIKSMIIFKVYPLVKEKNLRYHQYSLDWFVIRNILNRSIHTKQLIPIYSKMAHCSKSTFGSLFYPYFLTVLKSSDNIEQTINRISDDEKSLEYLKKEIL
jgi:replication factor C large subunit